MLAEQQKQKLTMVSHGNLFPVYGEYEDVGRVVAQGSIQLFPIFQNQSNSIQPTWVSDGPLKLNRNHTELLPKPAPF